MQSNPTEGNNEEVEGLASLQTFQWIKETIWTDLGSGNGNLYSSIHYVKIKDLCHSPINRVQP